LFSISSPQNIAPDTTAHCAVLQNKVGASLVGHTVNISQAHSVVSQNLEPKLSQVVLSAISLASLPFFSNSVAQKKPHTFHTCSVAIQVAHTLASNTNFKAFL